MPGWNLTIPGVLASPTVVVTTGSNSAAPARSVGLAKKEANLDDEDLGGNGYLGLGRPRGR
jgi:hypothetical protein